MPKTTSKKKTAAELLQRPDISEHIPYALMTEIYRAYDFFNDRFTQGRMARPMFVIATDTRKKAFGWFGPDNWKIADNKVSEIALHSSTLTLGIAHTMDTILHEMAHMKNYYDNDGKVVDCTDAQRHNKIFKTTAEFFGLLCTSSTRFGWGHTTLGPIGLKAVDELKVNTKVFELYINMKMDEEVKEKKQSNLAPVMIDKETKELISDAATALGITQKDLVTGAVNLRLNLKDLLTTTITALGAKYKKMKPEELIEALYIGLTPVVEAESDEEAEPEVKIEKDLKKAAKKQGLKINQ